MITNLDDVIDEYNEKELPKKIEEAQTNYYQVLDNVKDTQDGVMSIASTYTPVIREVDQIRTVRINKNELLHKLGIELEFPEDEYIELNVTVLGRECDIYGHPMV